MKGRNLSDFAGGELLEMVTIGWIGQITTAVERTVANSFHGDALIRPVLTRDEIQRRFDICIDGFRHMRRELHFAVPRILDELPAYLRHRLDNTPWDPSPGEGTWAADDPSGVALEIDRDAQDLNDG